MCMPDILQVLCLLLEFLAQVAALNSVNEMTSEVLSQVCVHFFFHFFFHLFRAFRSLFLASILMHPFVRFVCRVSIMVPFSGANSDVYTHCIYVVQLFVGFVCRGFGAFLQFDAVFF